MQKYSINAQKLRQSVRLVATLLVLLSFLFPNVTAGVYMSLLMEPCTTVTTPPVILEAGTAGKSTIYTNSTSAKVSVAASAPIPTYYPNSYNVLYGTYLSGTVPSSVQTVDSDYFIVRSIGTASLTTAYNPLGYSLLGSTTLVSGTTEDLVSNNGVYMTFRSYASATSAQTLYTHRETTTIGGLTYYLLKLGSADAAGLTLSADAGTTTGRKLIGKFVYQLTGVSSIPASTWTIYYRAYKGHVTVEAHGDVDVLVRMSNGTIRSTIATNVANSGALTTSWSTVSGTYSWAAYTVIDQTDYLEIDYYIEVTQIKAGYLVYLRIDDNTLAVADQTRATNIYLPSEYTSEVEFTGSSDTGIMWTQLEWTVDSSFTTTSVTTTFQLYNYQIGNYSTSGDGYMTDTIGTSDVTKTQTITTNPAYFRDASGNWKIKVKGVKSTSSQFDLKADWVEFKPTHYSEYTVSTEFLFTSMTKNTPTQLNFTIVSQYTVASVNVTIQVWNYSSPGYVASGQGYHTYTSSGSNETKTLSINTNPQSYTSSGNARIKITGVKTTTTQYQQETNQVKILYSYSSSSTYDYVLKVVNNATSAWKIRLKAYSQSNIERLNNCTIYFHNASDGFSGQVYIVNGNYTQQTGPWYDLSASPAERYIAVTLQASNSEVSYVNVYLEILIPEKTTYAQYVLTFEFT